MYKTEVLSVFKKKIGAFSLKKLQICDVATILKE